VEHRQVSANVRAFVAEDIKELVELLNTFDNVCTYRNCPGEAGEIYLYYGTEDCALENTWKNYLALSVFAKRLADAMTPVLGESRGLKSPLYYLNMSIKWCDYKDCPLFSIELPTDYLAEITDLFYKVKKEFDNSMKGKKDINLSALVTELS